MRVGRMVDAVLAAACGAPLKADNLGNESHIVEQIDLPRIDGGK